MTDSPWANAVWARQKSARRKSLYLVNNRFCSRQGQPEVRRIGDCVDIADGHFDAAQHNLPLPPKRVQGDKKLAASAMNVYHRCMVHTTHALNAHIDQLCAIEPALAAVIARLGYPATRVRPVGYETLLRTIVGQQVSVAAAASVWNRLETLVGSGCPPEALLAQAEEALRACGLSRQKQGYARSLAELVVSGAIDLHALPADDEDAIAELVKIKGIGRWSAEIYLLFAEGRPDIWPAGDLAIRIGVGQILGLPERPDEKQVRAIAEKWRPHRSAAALLAWQHYNGATL